MKFRCTQCFADGRCLFREDVTQRYEGARRTNNDCSDLFRVRKIKSAYRAFLENSSTNLEVYFLRIEATFARRKKSFPAVSLTKRPCTIVSNTIPYLLKMKYPPKVCPVRKHLQTIKKCKIKIANFFIVGFETFSNRVPFAGSLRISRP